MRILPVALAIAAMLPLRAPAQESGSSWRFGVLASPPAQLLEAGTGVIELGYGLGAEGARVWRLKSGASAAVLVRVQGASVRGELGGSSWDPGMALITDLSLRAERGIGRRTDLFGGVGVSHWSGPDDTPPFANAEALLLAAEGGVAWRPERYNWKLSFTAHATRFGQDDDRAMVSGTVIRWLIGASRDY